MTRALRASLVLAAVLVLLATSACGAGTERSRRPGLYELGEGRWRVVGTLRHEDLEGGFWAVYGAVPGQSGGVRLAVVRNAEKVGAARLEGKYVEAIGLIEDKSVSIRMAGPEIEASVLREIPVP